MLELADPGYLQRWRHYLESHPRGFHWSPEAVQAVVPWVYRGKMACWPIVHLRDEQVVLFALGG